MKNKIIMLFIPVLCLSLGTGRAAADDEGWYALGGFLGGVVATKVFDHHKSHHKHVTHVNTHCNSGCNSCQPKGYYKVVKVKVWVPGYWETRRDRCGHRVKHFVPGYYTYEKERVWVSTEKRHSGKNKHHNSHQYAYHHR